MLAVASSIGAAALSGACTERDGAAEASWSTSVDSTGDTTIIRITGDVPASQVRSLVAELRVGAEEGDERETFGAIAAVMGTASGGLLVHDDQASIIRLFDSTGAFVRDMGAKGGGPGEYEQLNGIARLADGSFVVWDASGNRLNLYAPTGDFVRTIRMPISGLFMNNGLHADRSGHLYANAILERHATDFTRSKAGFVKLDTAGTVLDSIPYLEWREGVPALRATSVDGRSSTATSVPFSPENVLRLLPSGGFVSGPGEPYVLYLTGEPGKKPVRIEREHSPVPVSTTESSERRAQIEQTMKRLDPNWTWTGPGIPAQKPAYRAVLVGQDGRIWVSLSTPGVPIPEEELPPIRAGAPPSIRLTTRDPLVYDVFSAEGRLLGRVSVPPKTRLYAMQGAHAWGVQRDSLDVEYAVRFRIEPALPEAR